MKITVLAPYTFGYIDALVEKLQEYDGVEVTFIQFQDFRYEYKSIFDRVYNFILKLTHTGNLKKNYISQQVKNKVAQLDYQDYILIIRPDKLENDLLRWLKKYTDNLISYYFDAIGKFPRKANIIKYFDEVYSYEKSDISDYNLKFITNFIPSEDKPVQSIENGVFNISSRDERVLVMQKIARQLKEYNFPFKFIVRSEKPMVIDCIEVIQEYMSMEDTKKYLNEASILLDIQKDDQEGLTFRVFEVLQFKKKLITTNPSIKSYDFYDANNILVIDKEKPIIPLEFLNTTYNDIPESIVQKYRRSAWIEQVFGLKE